MFGNRPSRKAGPARLVLAGLALLSLAGCKNLEAARHAVEGTPLASFAVADAISVINTQKTVDDHLVSLVVGKDCSTVRASQGEPYCIAPPPVVPLYHRVTYCYKSLARVTCFDRPVDSDAAVLVGTRVDDIPVTASR